MQLVFKPIEPNVAAYFEAVYGDQNRFMQVIINFLSNSLKFSNSGSKVIIFLQMLENQTLSTSNMLMQKFTLKRKPPKKAVSHKNVGGFESQMQLIKSHFLVKSNSRPPVM